MVILRRAHLLLAAQWLLACASLSPVPDQGGPAWLRLETEHFVLHTDLSEPQARDTISTFEQLLDAYVQLGWETTGKLPSRLDIVVFEDQSDFEVFAGDSVGFHTRFTPFEPLVVMPNAGRIDGWSTLKHELTHYIAYQALPFQPPWFSEGLAVYFQTAYFNAEQHFVVGEAPRDLHRSLRYVGPELARDLLRAETAELRPRFYASAWLLVHYLMSERGDAFVKLQNGFAGGLNADAAWSSAFPDLEIGQLDQVLLRYYEEGKFANYTRPVRPFTGVTPTVRRLSSADVYALRARLFLSCPACGPEQRRTAAENVEQALRRDPQQLVASVLHLGTLPPGQRVQAARALTQAHPEAWQAWAVLVMAEQSAAQRWSGCSAEARNRLHELGANSAHALMFSAMCRAVQGEKEEALAASSRALRRQPADTILLTMQASVLSVLRECEALQKLMPRLRGAVHPRIDADTLSELAACSANETPR